MLFTQSKSDKNWPRTPIQLTQIPDFRLLKKPSEPCFSQWCRRTVNQSDSSRRNVSTNWIMVCWTEIPSEKARNTSSPLTINADFIPGTNGPNISQKSSNQCFFCAAPHTWDICLHQRGFKIFPTLNMKAGVIYVDECYTF